jgi:hypothetical protein
MPKHHLGHLRPLGSCRPPVQSRRRSRPPSLPGPTRAWRAPFTRGIFSASRRTTDLRTSVFIRINESQFPMNRGPSPTNHVSVPSEAQGNRIFPAVVTWSDLSAVRAAGVSPGWPYPDDKTTPIEIEAFYEKTGNPDQFFDKLVGAHVLLPVPGLSCNAKKQEKSCAFQYLEVDSSKIIRAVAQVAPSSDQRPTPNAGEPKKIGKDGYGSNE